MNKTFIGLEYFGIFKAGDINVFDDDEKALTPSIYAGNEYSNFVLERDITCPVCNTTFKTTGLRAKKAKLIGTDIDLKPNYQELETICYDVTTCSICGYTSLTSTFEKLTPAQVENIKNNVSQVFINFTSLPLNVSIEEAILKFKLALLNCVYKESPASEKGFTAMKIAWLYRALGDSISENHFLKIALKGFTKAYMEEDFPVMSMDQQTMDYVMGAINYKLGNLEDAKTKVGAVIVDKQTSPKLKERAETLLESVRKDLKQKNEEKAEELFDGVKE